MGTFFNGECNEGRDYFLYFFSEVWLCWDLTEKKFVALKVVKSASHYTGFAILIKVENYICAMQKLPWTRSSC